MLWDELALAKKDTTKMNNIYIQNIMRRIVENYFRFAGINVHNEISEDKFSDDEKVIMHSLTAWSHDGSHCCPDDFYYSIDGDFQTYLEAFKKLFNVLGHIEHYNMMMKE